MPGGRRGSYVNPALEAQSSTRLVGEPIALSARYASRPASPPPNRFRKPALAEMFPGGQSGRSSRR